MRCPNCNHENNDSAKFCEECGEKLDVEVVSQLAVPSLECPECHSHDVVDDGTGLVQFLCHQCGHAWGDYNGVLKCPECESDIIEYQQWDVIYYRCKSCGSYFENGFNPEDCERQILSLLKDKDKDTQGNELSKYFEFFGIILGLSDHQVVTNLGGRLVDATCEEYLLPNHIRCSFLGCSQFVNYIKFSNKKNTFSLPLFYRNLGLRLDISKEGFIDLFNGLGLNVLNDEESNKVVASCFCRKYKATLDITFRSWQEDDGEERTFISFFVITN